MLGLPTLLIWARTFCYCNSTEGNAALIAAADDDNDNNIGDDDAVVDDGVVVDDGGVDTKEHVRTACMTSHQW